ncbi:MAG TPA: shikimate kinase [Patescibacteria group bacterium]|jgi:shikimate kinase|nr:shikimate kinase [Patescibacteria group bacterium]
MTKQNKITIIGMPWAGKTTTAKALAEKLDYEFIDLDQEVEKEEGMNLIEIMNTKGADYFRQKGFEYLQKFTPEDRVIISPAGSVIYNERSMNWLKGNSLVIFLDTPFEVIEARSKTEPKAVANLKERGLQGIWDERIPIYEKNSDLTVETVGKSLDEIVEDIIKVI